MSASGRTVSAADGRHRRSSDSRQRIVTAMLVLVRGGAITPTAAQVAAEAGVGLRSVFRHFEDMDRLYREMAERTAATILPVLLKPYRSADWRGQLDELVDRRRLIYEDILPLKTAGNLQRHRSAFLMEDYRQHLALERRTLDAVLPAAVRRDRGLHRALEMTLSFQSWSQLRQAQQLSPAQATRTVRRLIEALLHTPLPTP